MPFFVNVSCSRHGQRTYHTIFCYSKQRQCPTSEDTVMYENSLALCVIIFFYAAAVEKRINTVYLHSMDYYTTEELSVVFRFLGVIFKNTPVSLLLVCDSASNSFNKAVFRTNCGDSTEFKTLTS